MIFQATRPIETPIWRGLFVAGYLFGNLLVILIINKYVLPFYVGVFAKRSMRATLEQFNLEFPKVNG